MSEDNINSCLVALVLIVFIIAMFWSCTAIVTNK